MKPLHFCPSVSASIRSFAVLKKKEILHHILPICLSSLPIFLLSPRPVYPKLFAVSPICYTFISSFLLLTVSFLAHLPGSPTVRGHSNNETELFFIYWLFTSLKSHFHSLFFQGAKLCCCLFPHLESCLCKHINRVDCLAMNI